MTARRRFATAVLLGAGRGERIGGETAKQFVDLSGHPMIVHSVAALGSSASVSALVVVLPEGRPAFIDDELRGFDIEAVVTGGPTRQDSLAQGIVCVPDETEIVVVHDAARPLVTSQLVDRVVSGVSDGFHGCIAAIRMDDAVKEVSLEKEVLSHRPKRHLWRSQTPQAFERDALEDSLARMVASGDVSEDCSEMLTRAGYRVRVVEGDSRNIKVTRPADIGLCERIMDGNSTRQP